MSDTKGKAELKKVSTMLWQGTVINARIKTAIGINNSLKNLYFRKYRTYVKELKK